ncbi:tRNA1(Val) (adenine(37)-N6)-methyltransferase [Bartonella sp. DGB1]|uniref:tRNA1(Val) (adenine(37)-N6)-methyltransferase n=1 Tax=Bartonella sp. DGB1 TaxID=3239807 RepID=UPI00352333DE
MDNIEITCDAFHRGRFYLLQPKKIGHRSGVDAMLLASSVSSNFSGNLVDLGSGVGAVAYAVLSRCKNAKATLVENDPFMIELAEKTLNLPQNTEFLERIRILKADIGVTGQQRIKSGLIDNYFDFALINPPFNAWYETKTPRLLKQHAHVMQQNMIEQWIKTAAIILKSKAYLAMIARPFCLAEILHNLEKYFGDINIVAIHSKRKQNANRIIILARKASKKPLSIKPALILHSDEDSSFLPEIEELLNGKKSIFDI